MSIIKRIKRLFGYVPEPIVKEKFPAKSRNVEYHRGALIYHNRDTGIFARFSYNGNIRISHFIDGESLMIGPANRIVLGRDEDVLIIKRHVAGSSPARLV